MRQEIDNPSEIEEFFDRFVEFNNSNPRNRTLYKLTTTFGERTDIVYFIKNLYHCSIVNSPKEMVFYDGDDVYVQDEKIRISPTSLCYNSSLNSKIVKFILETDTKLPFYYKNIDRMIVNTVLS